MAVVKSPPVLMTAEEFVAQHENDRMELINGVAVELTMPFAAHGKVCSLINYFITDFVIKHDLGHVMGNDSFMRTTRTPDSVRGPDVMYFSYERLPRGSVPGGLLSVSPDPVVKSVPPATRSPR